VGQALNLNGAGQYVLIPHPADGALDFGPESGAGSRDFSIDAWIRPDLYFAYRAIFWKGSKQAYAFGLRHDRLSLLMKSTGGLREAVSAAIPNLTAGVWHLAAVTVDRNGGTSGGALVRFYFDGELVDVQSLAPLSGTLNNTGGAGIGFAHVDGSGFPEFSQSFRGAIDEVEVFPYVLEPSTIRDLWIANAGGKCQTWCSVPAVRALCTGETSVTVPVEIHNPTPIEQTYTPTGSGIPIPAGFQFGGQTSNVDGPPVSASSFSPSGSTSVVAGGVRTIDLTLDRPAGFTAHGKRAAYRVTMSSPNGDRHCVGFLVDARNNCPRSGNGGHGSARVGISVPNTFEIRNDSGVATSYELLWRVQDSVGASDVSVVSLGSLPPGEPLARTSAVAQPGETITEEVLVTPVAHEGMRAFDVVLHTDLDGDGEPEPITSAGLRTQLPPPERVPGRRISVVPGRVTLSARPATGTRFALPDASDDPTIAGGSLEVFDSGGSGSDLYPLPAGGWRGLGNPAGAKGYRYRGAGSPGDPCTTVLIKNKVVKARCRGLGVALSIPFAGDAAFVLSIGSSPKRYCGTFGGETVRNDPVLFKRKDAPAPDRCAMPTP
jgi:hypothetical protein